MKKYRFILFAFLLLPGILSGCRRYHASENTTISPRVVTQVDVICKREDTSILRSYTHPKKMETILVYLRLLEPLGKAETDPERILGDQYEIVLRFSDGRQRIYRQRANAYLSKDFQPWYRIDPEHAGVLYSILQDMPSDTV